MATERIQPRPYIRLLLLAGLVGFVGAVITFSFMWVVREAAHLIWASTEDSSDVWRPIFTVVICTVAGIKTPRAGAAFILLFRALRRLMEPMRKHVILRGLLGGLGLGIAGAFFPLVLFSGEEQTHTLITDAATIGVVTLIVLAVLKLVVT